MLGEVAADAAPALLAVRDLAAYLKAPAAGRDAALAAAARWAADPDAGNPTVALVAGTLFALEGEDEQAMRTAAGAPRSLECLALGAQCCLRLGRPDAAERLVAAMAAAADDATLTQLASAWVGLHQGGTRVQEAYYAFQELGDRYSWTVRLHNGLAAAQMRMGRWEDAEAELLQAFEKSPKDGDTLANLAAVSLHLGKPAARYAALLRAAAPGHPLAARAAAGEAALDAALATAAA